jgi:hypothetical protein
MQRTTLSSSSTPEHLGHDDVEQDEIDRLRARVAQPRKCLATIPCFDCPVADAFEQTDQQASVERRVVDDQDPCRVHACDRPSGLAAARSSTRLAATRVAWRASGTIGFAM